MEAHLQGLANPKHRAQWRSTLATYAYPTLGQRSVASITRMEVADVLRPIWNTKRETARRVGSTFETDSFFAAALRRNFGDEEADPGKATPSPDANS